MQRVKSSFQELQRFGVTNEKGVVPSMAIEMVRGALSNVRFVSQSQTTCPERYGDGRKQSHRGSIERMRKHDITIRMSQIEDLVIRLTIIGREESTHQWEVALRAPCPVFLPQGELSHRYCRS